MSSRWRLQRDAYPTVPLVGAPTLIEVYKSKIWWKLLASVRTLKNSMHRRFATPWKSQKNNIFHNYCIFCLILCLLLPMGEKNTRSVSATPVTFRFRNSANLSMSRPHSSLNSWVGCSLLTANVLRLLSSVHGFLRNESGGILGLHGGVYVWWAIAVGWDKRATGSLLYCRPPDVTGSEVRGGGRVTSVRRIEFTVATGLLLKSEFDWQNLTNILISFSLGIVLSS